MTAMELMTTEEFAEYVRTPAATIRYWHHRGEGPVSYKVGRRRMYKKADIDAWFEQQIDHKVGA